MLYREIIVVFSNIRTKQINTLCGQNVTEGQKERNLVRE